MSEEIIKNVEVEEQKSFVLPAGATIIKKTINMSVRKIKNGYVLRKSYDIKWKKVVMIPNMNTILMNGFLKIIQLL